MKSHVVIIGIGEIGAVLARGFLKTGLPVFPVTRDMNLREVAQEMVNPEAVVVAVGENELPGILAIIPPVWVNKLVLIQNELLPRDWKSKGLEPTVASIWFEKKKGQDVKVVVASPIYGPKATLVSNALTALDIPNKIITDAEQMTFELVRKNYYILTSNIAGLRVGGTVGELWENHQDFARNVIADIHKIQEFLVSGSANNTTLNKEKLTEAMVEAFEGDPQHGCMGRSAPARLDRALNIAEQAGIPVPTLSSIAQSSELQSSKPQSSEPPCTQTKT